MNVQVFPTLFSGLWLAGITRVHPVSCRSCHELATQKIGKLSQLSIPVYMCQGSKLLYNGQINPCCWVDEFIPYHNGKNGEFRPQCYICLYREFSMTALACLDQFLQMFCRTWFVSMQPHIPSRRRKLKCQKSECDWVKFPRFGVVSCIDIQSYLLRWNVFRFWGVQKSSHEAALDV